MSLDRRSAAFSEMKFSSSRPAFGCYNPVLCLLFLLPAPSIPESTSLQSTFEYSVFHFRLFSRAAAVTGHLCAISEFNASLSADFATYKNETYRYICLEYIVFVLIASRIIGFNIFARRCVFCLPLPIPPCFRYVPKSISRNEKAFNSYFFQPLGKKLLFISIAEDMFSAHRIGTCRPSCHEQISQLPCMVAHISRPQYSKTQSLNSYRISQLCSYFYAFSMILNYLMIM